MNFSFLTQPLLKSKLAIAAYPMRRFLFAAASLLLFSTVAAIAVVPLAPAPSFNDIQIQPQDFALPTVAESLTQPTSSNQTYIHEETVRNGDTLAAMLARLQVQDPDLSAFLAQDTKVRVAFPLRAGRNVQAQTDTQGQLQWLRYTPAVTENVKNSANKVIVLRRQNNLKAPFVIQETLSQNETRTEIRSGIIRSSLYGATDAAEIPDVIANQMAEIMSGDIDFHRDLRKGDHFRVVYEMDYQGQSGEDLKSGRVLALDFFANRQMYHAIRFGNEYYNQDGQSLRKTFLRSPMAFTRVTSGFAMRFHPILKTWRAHKGLDYGASTGTPIRAVADGTVKFSGVKGGYGNVVILRHSAQYSTLYGHMSKFGRGIKSGASVVQGQIIGYVGQTGWATGPHLHYEFLVNGKQRNPLTIALPTARPLTGSRLASFHQTFQELRNKFALIDIDANSSASLRL